MSRFLSIMFYRVGCFIELRFPNVANKLFDISGKLDTLEL